MNVSETDRNVVDRLCAAMQTGVAAHDDLVELFAEDGELVEPFTGETLTHTGKPAIRRRTLEMLVDERPPGFEIHIDRVDMDGDQVVAEWSCTSSENATPFQGIDHYTIRAGKIARLEVMIKGYASAPVPE